MLVERIDKEIADLRLRIEKLEAYRATLPRRYGSTVYVTIDATRNENGKYIIPESVFIPSRYWGVEVATKDIAWMVQEDDD